MRPGQPPDRIVRGSLFDAFTPRSGETTVPVRQRPARSATFTSTAATSRFNEPLSRNLCSGQRPNPLLEQEVEEAAVPGQPARARAHFRFPPAIHPRELPAATSVTAINRSASVESSNVFAAPTLRENVTTGNRKTLRSCEQPVEDQPSLWKAEEKRGVNLR